MIKFWLLKDSLVVKNDDSAFKVKIRKVFTFTYCLST